MRSEHDVISSEARVAKKKKDELIKWQPRRHWSQISTDRNTDVLTAVLKEQL